MKNRILTSALAISVTLIAGAAFSGGSKTDDSELVDFDQSTGQLWAIPKNQSNATEFQHTSQTVHLEGDLRHFAPPNPCDELGHLWNFTVHYDRHYRTESRGIYEALLGLMAQNSCGATISAVSGSPPPITSIAPNAAK